MIPTEQLVSLAENHRIMVLGRDVSEEVLSVCLGNERLTREKDQLKIELAEWTKVTKRLEKRLETIVYCLFLSGVSAALVAILIGIIMGICAMIRAGI